MSGGRGGRNASEKTAALLDEWKQLVTQMPIFLQKEDRSLRVWRGGVNFRAVELCRPDEDLRKVACGVREKSFAKVGEYSDLCPCSFCEGKAFGEVWVCRVVVL